VSTSHHSSRWWAVCIRKTRHSPRSVLTPDSFPSKASRQWLDSPSAGQGNPCARAVQCFCRARVVTCSSTVACRIVLGQQELVNRLFHLACRACRGTKQWNLRPFVSKKVRDRTVTPLVAPSPLPVASTCTFSPRWTAHAHHTPSSRSTSGGTTPGWT
jgi:hypothetical protein